jgi:hypothetical protein
MIRSQVKALSCHLLRKADSREPKLLKTKLLDEQYTWPQIKTDSCKSTEFRSEFSVRREFIVEWSKFDTYERNRFNNVTNRWLSTESSEASRAEILAAAK